MGPTPASSLDESTWCDRLLGTLAERLGPGLAAAREDARLRTAIEQHCLQVRGWLGARDLQVTRQSVAGYTAALLAAAQSCGRALPEDPRAYDWSAAEWYVVRLLALCCLDAGVA